MNENDERMGHFCNRTCKNGKEKPRELITSRKNGISGCPSRLYRCWGGSKARQGGRGGGLTKEATPSCVCTSAVTHVMHLERLLRRGAVSKKDVVDVVESIGSTLRRPQSAAASHFHRFTPFDLMHLT